MPSLSEIKNKTKLVPYDYHGTIVNMNVKVNFITSELEEKIKEISDKPESGDHSEVAEEIASILATIISTWDIEDALPTKEVLVDLGVIFMSGAFAEISQSILPKNATGNA